MLSRRQKRSLRTFAVALSCCVLLSGVLVYVTLNNGISAEPVVFADILEGARITADELPDHFIGNVVTVESDALTETMFSAELRTYTRPETDADDDRAQGAGGTLLLNTTPITADTPQIIETFETPETVSKIETEPVIETETEDTDITDTAVTDTTTRRTRRTTTTTTKAPVTQTTTAPVTTRPPVTQTTTARTYATIYTSESKAPFINVGGGVMSNDESVYLALIELVNAERRKAGLNELWYSARLHDVCKTRVVELTSYYSHTRPDGTKFSTAYLELGISFQVCGENIAYGKNMFKTPEEVFEAWMNSRSHRENILYPDYDCAAFGLSVIKVGSDTYYYWTQEFAKF